MGQHNIGPPVSLDDPYQPHRTLDETQAANAAKLEAFQHAQSEAFKRLLATPGPVAWTPSQRSRAEAALFPPAGYGSVTIPYYQPATPPGTVPFWKGDPKFIAGEDAAFLRSLGIAP